VNAQHSITKVCGRNFFLIEKLKFVILAEKIIKLIHAKICVKNRRLFPPAKHKICIGTNTVITKNIARKFIIDASDFGKIAAIIIKDKML